MEYTKEQMKLLQKALYDMYQDNLKFLQIYQKDLYLKILNLSESIDNNSYKIRFDLEFINGSFNIYDNMNKKYLYEKSLEDYSKDVFDYIDYTKKGSLINLPDELYNVDDVTELRLFNDDYETKAFKRIVSDINKIKKTCDIKTYEENKEFKYIPSFMFYGTLLAQHLKSVQEKLKCKSYLIIEPDLEIFRLSLFVTEYKLLTKDARLFFSIGEDDNDMIKSMEKFVLFDSLETYLYKYYSTSFHEKNLFSNFTIALQNVSPRTFDHYRQLHYFTQSIKNFQHYPMLVTNKEKNNLENLPVLILSPGPSLRENFKWLKKNHKKFIIVSFAATIKALGEIGIKPDIITSVESSTLVRDQLPKKYKKIYKDSIAILSSDTHEEIFEYFDKNKIFIFEPNYRILENGIEESPSLTVGETTIHLLLLMGFKNLYLLGTDLSLDSKGIAYDKTHMASETSRSLHHLKKNIKRISNEVKIDNNYLEVKSNFENRTLYSDQLFLKILASYKSIISYHKEKKDFEIYNLSSGAYIEHTKPLPPKECNLEEIEVKEKELLSFIKSKSRRNFSENEKKEFYKEAIFIEKLIQQLEYTLNMTLSDSKKFYAVRKDIAKQIREHKSFSSLTMAMLSTYIKITDNLINYKLNNKKDDINNKELNDLKVEWGNQFRSFLLEFLKSLHSVQL